MNLSACKEHETERKAQQSNSALKPASDENEPAPPKETSQIFFH